MPWIQREADEHKCSLPAHERGDGVTTGDIWECPDCGSQYQVRVEYDQREPGYWFTWTTLTKKFLPQQGGLTKP